MYLDEGCHAPCTRHFSWNRQDAHCRNEQTTVTDPTEGYLSVGKNAKFLGRGANYVVVLIIVCSLTSIQVEHCSADKGNNL